MSPVSWSERRAALNFCVECATTVLLMIVLVWASFAYLALDLSRLFTAESGRSMVRFALRFFPPDLSAGFLRKIGIGTLETLAISALGTLLAAGAGLLLALPAAGRLGAAPKV